MHVPMKFMRIFAWSIGMGLALSVLGAILAATLQVGPDSMGGTFAGELAGILCVYHLWAWASILPLDAWLSHGPLAGLLVGVLLPATDWAVVTFGVLCGVNLLRKTRA